MPSAWSRPSSKILKCCPSRFRSKHWRKRLAGPPRIAAHPNGQCSEWAIQLPRPEVAADALQADPAMMIGSVDSLNRIESWLTEAGLAGASETESLHGFCDRCRGAGIALSRASLIVDTLHPIHEGHVFRWREDGAVPSVVEYGPSNVGETAANWQNSTFYRLIQTGAS